MHTPRRRKLQLEINRIDLFDHLIWTNKTTGKLRTKPRNQRKMLSGQLCMITNNKITITTMLVGLVSHSMIGNLQLLMNLLYYLLHRSNAINSCLYPRISHITNSNLQRKIGFTTKNYKGRWLFGTGIMSRIQSKPAKRQEHIPIVLTSINIALQNLLKTSMHSLWLPVCLWMIRWRLCMSIPKSRNQSRPESQSKPGIILWNDSMRHPIPSHNGTKEQLR